MPKLLLLLQMVLTLYHNHLSYPSRAAFMVARAVGVDIRVKNINLLENEHLSPEFTKVSQKHFLCVCHKYM
jgi:glutathione S-transferase